MRWDIYVAAGFGAFASTLADLMWNPITAMTLKLKQVLVENVYIGLDAGWPVLVLMILLGMGAAFVSTPALRVDAFARGLAVFALLSLPPSPSEIAAPQAGLYDVSPKSAQHSFSILPGIRPAHAQFGGGGGFGGGGFGGSDASPSGPGLVVGPPASSKAWPYEYASKPAVVQFDYPGDPPNQSDASLVLQNLDTGKTTRIRWNTMIPFTISAPEGTYSLEVNLPGYQRTRSIFSIGNEIGVFKLGLSKSATSLGIQQLFASDVVPLARVEPPEAQQILERAGLAAR